MADITAVSDKNGDEVRSPLTIERRRKIAALVSARGTVRVAELGKLFRVSEVTIRNDLERLAADGVLVRDHGGAVALTFTTLSGAFEQRAMLNLDAKQRIGQAAANLIQSGAVIMLDAGSTLMEMAKRLPAVSPLTIITNALNIATQLGSRPGVHVVLAGGSLSPETISTLGPLAERDLGDLRVNKVFLGIHSFEMETGLSDPSIEVARVKAAMISAAKEDVLLADSTKYPARALARVAPLSVVSLLITDTGLPEEAAQRLMGTGIKVMRV